MHCGPPNLVQKQSHLSTVHFDHEPQAHRVSLNNLWLSAYLTSDDLLCTGLLVPLDLFRINNVVNKTLKC